LYWTIISPEFQQSIIDNSSATTLPIINKGRFERLLLPAISLEEQREIVRRIETVFAKIDSLAAQAKRALDLTNRLDEAILAKAFRGELVSQDPNDEPAITLLVRIRAERDSEPKPRRARTSTKRKDAAMARNLVDVLAEAADWLPTQEAFRRCGITDGAETDAIELLYAELRTLDKSGRLKVESVADEQGRKLYDRLKLLEA
jgi:type I restriction enzyme S subunit